MTNMTDKKTDLLLYYVINFVGIKMDVVNNFPRQKTLVAVWNRIRY